LHCQGLISLLKDNNDKIPADYLSKTFYSLRQATQTKNKEEIRRYLQLFKERIEKLDPQYAGNNQHDSYELLGLILSTIDQELSNAIGKKIDLTNFNPVDSSSNELVRIAL